MRPRPTKQYIDYGQSFILSRDMDADRRTNVYGNRYSNLKLFYNRISKNVNHQPRIVQI